MSREAINSLECYARQVANRFIDFRNSARAGISVCVPTEHGDILLSREDLENNDDDQVFEIVKAMLSVRGAK